MPSTKNIAFLVAAVDFVFGGLLSNGFITAVLINGWIKTRSLAANEQLILSLSISNISFTVLQILQCFAVAFPILFSISLMVQVYISFSTYVALIRYWMTAWLCVFYCIKILNRSHPFLLWWKIRISRLVPWITVGSNVTSFLVCILMVLSVSMQFQSYGAGNITTATQKQKWVRLCQDFRISFFTIGSGFPLLIVLLCSILVVSFLCQHAHQMMSKEPNIKSLQTEAHIKAARTVLSLLFLYIYFYVAHTMSIILDLQKNQMIYKVIVAVMSMYSPIQAAILILSNSKLKQTASWMLTRTKS